MEIRRTTTVRQLEILVEFAEGNRDLALGRLRSKEARALSSRLWRECSVDLNSEGPARNPKEWTKIWNDMKSRVRSKLAAINQCNQGTGGGPSLPVRLSALEDRVADILGRDVGPLAGVAQDPFEEQAISEERVPVLEGEFLIENIEQHVSDEVFAEDPQLQQFEGPNSQSPPQLRQLALPLPPPPPPPQPTGSQTSTPRRGRGRRPRRSRRSAPNTPRTSRVQTQAQSSRTALDESRAMVMRIEELRARTDQMVAQSALTQAEAAKAHAEAAKAQAEAALIAANAQRLNAETMAAFSSSLSSLVPAITLFLRRGTKRTRRISDDDAEDLGE